MLVAIPNHGSKPALERFAGVLKYCEPKLDARNWRTAAAPCVPPRFCHARIADNENPPASGVDTDTPTGLLVGESHELGQIPRIIFVPRYLVVSGSMQPNEAQQMDCDDIASAFEGQQLQSFFKGFVNIKTTQPISVVGAYTRGLFPNINLGNPTRTLSITCPRSEFRGDWKRSGPDGGCFSFTAGAGSQQVLCRDLDQVLLAAAFGRIPLAATSVIKEGDVAFLCGDSIVTPWVLDLAGVSGDSVRR